MANGDSSNPLAVYGYDQQTGQQLAQSLGMTTAQLAAAFATTPMTGGGSSNQNQFLGGSSVSQGYNAPSRDLGQTVQQLQMMKAAGMGGSGAGQAGQAGTFASGPVDYSGSRAAENLGAQALGAAGFSGAQGAFPIYNPIPGQGGQFTNAKGGVSAVSSPVVANAIPTGPTPNVASVLGQPSQQGQGLQYWQQQAGGGSAADAAAIEKAQGMAPGTIGQQFYNQGVQAGAIKPLSSTPTAGGTPTPVMPANAPGGQPATPWATAPPAPGAQVQGAIPDWAHTGALQNAGKAIFAHMTGGDPDTATHADIADFHNQLTSMIGRAAGAVGGTPFGNAPPGAANYTGGVQPGIPATGAPPKPMATGGMVPGRGNQDTVPALLTPGEYVIPKDQAAQIFGGRTPIRMADGGYVPPEVRRQRITPPGAPPAAPSQQATGQQSGQQGSSSDGSGGQSQQQGYWSNIVQNAQAQQAANMGSGGPGSLDSLGSLGDEGLANQAIQGTGANAVAGGADIAGGLISGLQQAWDKYAKSIKPWQMIAQDFGKGGTPNYQDVNFQQDTTV